MPHILTVKSVCVMVGMVIAGNWVGGTSMMLLAYLSNDDEVQSVRTINLKALPQ